MKIYLDICCFNRPFDAQEQLRIRLETEAKLQIQDRIRHKRFNLVWSYMLDYENAANPFVERKDAIAQWAALAVADVEENQFLLRKAAQLQRLGLKGKDALHLACALAAKCDYFLTTDRALLKKAAQVVGLRVINPVEFFMTVIK